MAVVAVLVDKGLSERALDLVGELRLFLPRLKLTPSFTPTSRPSGTDVRLVPIGDASAALRAVRTPAQLTTMRATLTVWNPLSDRLVALWCRTVDTGLPRLDETGAVQGGWPARRWPMDWEAHRDRWLADYSEACEKHQPSGRHFRPNSNFTRLYRALALWSPQTELPAREIGWVRRALANSVTRRGEPGSARHAQVRAAQERSIAAPAYTAFARVLADRLDRYPPDGGLPALAPVTGEVTRAEHPDLAGTPLPAHLVDKVARVLEAPPDELVRLGVIASGEQLAEVLPQLNARLLAATVEDPDLAGLYEHTYTAFRRRRSLLLVNLQHQVQFSELPWVRAMATVQTARADPSGAARRTCEQATVLALTAWPQALLPNPLIRELAVLAEQAGMRLPLVEEVAADIFMGTFTTKWRDAAALTSTALNGTLYAAYYDLPPAGLWTDRSMSVPRWGKQTARDFTALCVERAREAGAAHDEWSVARNGALLEQSQILTTHNLAALVFGLGLEERVREQAPRLAGKVLSWTVRRLAQPATWRKAALIQVKNAAYAWRQAIFLLSFCPADQQRDALAELRSEAADAGLTGRLGPAIDGLARVLDGERFALDGTQRAGSGRRLLGWAVDHHWYLDPDR